MSSCDISRIFLITCSDTRNPMVAGFAEDIESEDEDVQPSRPLQSAVNHVHSSAKPNDQPKPVVAAIELTSSEEERGEEEDEEEEEDGKKWRKKEMKASRPADLQLTQDIADFSFANDEVSSWLNSPDIEPEVGLTSI